MQMILSKTMTPSLKTFQVSRIYMVLTVFLCKITRAKYLLCYPDPFGGDPFKGSDPFATDSFFKQSSSTTFSSEDPFASSDPFSSNTGPAEPDLFSSQLNSTNASDPFSKSNAVAADPFSSSGDLDDSDPFSSAAGPGNDPFVGSELSSVSSFPCLLVINLLFILPSLFFFP